MVIPMVIPDSDEVGSAKHPTLRTRSARLNVSMPRNEIGHRRIPAEDAPPDDRPRLLQALARLPEADQTRTARTLAQAENALRRSIVESELARHRLGTLRAHTGEAAVVRAQDFPIEPAIRLSMLTRTESFRTSLVMPGFGRFRIAVRNRSSRLVLRIGCDTKASYGWLSSQRDALQARLVRAFDRPVRVSLALVGAL